MGNLNPKRVSTKQQGDAAEALALAHLQGQGMRLLKRNYRTPGRGGGEIDLIMRRRIVWAARHYLSRLDAEPPCRFDVIVVEPDGLAWIQAAFDAM